MITHSLNLKQKAAPLARPIGLASGASLIQTAVRVTDILLRWQERVRSRRQLASMSEHMLRDIGLDHGYAEEEWRKPFWRD